MARRTERLHPYDTILLGFRSAAFALYILLVILAGVTSPDLRAEAPHYTAQQLAAAEGLRAVQIDPDNPLALVQDVDYAQGSAAA